MGCDIFQQDLNSYNLLFSFCFNKRLKSTIPFYYFVLFFMVHHVDFFHLIPGRSTTRLRKIFNRENVYTIRDTYGL